MSKPEIVGRTKYPKTELKQLVQTQLQARLSEIDVHLDQLTRTVGRLRRKYHLSWEAFQAKLEAGRLADDADLDYVEWKAAVSLLVVLKRERSQLKEVWGGAHSLTS